MANNETTRGRDFFRLTKKDCKDLLEVLTAIDETVPELTSSENAAFNRLHAKYAERLQAWTENDGR